MASARYKVKMRRCVKTRIHHRLHGCIQISSIGYQQIKKSFSVNLCNPVW